MKQLFAIVISAALCAGVHAQVTCQTYGNTTNCDGSLGHSGISPLTTVPTPDFGNDIAAQQQAVAQANLANQQAALVAQQREYLRQQTEALQRQQISESWERQQQDAVSRQQQRAEDLQRQQEAEALKRQQQAAASKKQQDNEDLQRMQNDEAPQEQQYDGPLKQTRVAPSETLGASAMLACVRRFPPGQTEEEVSAISDRCQKNTRAAPKYQREAATAQAEQGTATQGTARSPAAAPAEPRLTRSDAAAPPSGPGPQFRQRWNALDDALANGVITRPEYDKKLSALLAKQGHSTNDRIVSQVAAK